MSQDPLPSSNSHRIKIDILIAADDLTKPLVCAI
jgi:hypothetical protein